MSTAKITDPANPRRRFSAIAKAVGHALLFICLSSMAATAAAESALEAWRGIKDRGRCDDYRRFLGDYGDTPLASMARRKTEECDRKDLQALADEWRRVKGRGSCKGYRAFLASHPDAPGAAEARAEIDRCEAEQEKAAEEARRRAEAEMRERAQREAEQRARSEAEEETAREQSEAEERAARDALQAQQDLGCGQGFWSANQLAAYFGNHTWEGKAGRTKWQEFYASDGSMRGRAWKDGQRRPAYRGRWYLDGDRYCYCTADCRSYACRKVRQMGCQTWTWDIDRNKKRSQVTKVYRGNPLGL